MSPRATRLLRAPDLASFRETLVALIIEGSPLDARDRLVIVPTRAAAEQLVRSVERLVLPSGGALLLPDFVTPTELVGRLASRLASLGAGKADPGGDAGPMLTMLTAAERQTLMGVACREAAAGGDVPPFQLRPGIVAEVLEFYDALQRHQKNVDAFARLTLGRLEPGADLDRGAARLLQQTHFLVAAFRHFERLSRGAGGDEHQQRARLLTEPASRPWRHLVVAVGDQAFDTHGLVVADWDLIARLPGLQRIDVVTTNESLAGAPHERVHFLLPGIEEVHLACSSHEPRLVVPDDAHRFHTARDREEEIAAFATWIKPSARAGAIDVERTALVVNQPLPYLYLAREVFRSAGIPCQMFDALPLAAESYAGAIDLVFTCVTSGFAREPAVALLRSPWFRREEDGCDEPGLIAFDRRLAEAGYLGELPMLEQLIERWQMSPPSGATSAMKAATTLVSWCRELADLREPQPVAAHLDTVLRFLERHDAVPAAHDGRDAQLRTRRAVRGVLVTLRDAFARFDPTEVPFEDVVSLVRRAIEERTFAPRAGESGVHVLDAQSARFGDFDVVQLSGVVEGEWPGRSKRNIFYGPDILRELGWPSDADRRDATRAHFIDLLRLPSSRLRVSVFSLELDAIVSPSPLLSELHTAQLSIAIEPVPAIRVFEYDALTSQPIALDALSPGVHEWARLRQMAAETPRRPAGQIDRCAPRPYSLSALERYQDCGFRFFAADVLGLEESPEDQSSLTPRRRGQMLHEILHRFFAEWDSRGGGPLSAETIEQAQAVFASIAEPILSTLPESEAMLERTRLFGSAISVGIADVVLASEAVRDDPAEDRWLEYRLEGEFTLGVPDGSSVSLRGVADRIDLLSGRRLRVVDYKSGAVPAVTRALQAPVYALCAQERLTTRDGQPWAIEEASYVALAGRRSVVPVVDASDSDTEKRRALSEARARLFAVVEGISAGAFSPRPYDTVICRSCAFSTVCRKDYAGDE